MSMPSTPRDVNNPGAAGPYSNAFYERMLAESLASAREVVPVVMALVRPRRVVDLGCGIGTWLSVFGEHGVGLVRGVDGPWVDRNQLLIPSEHFVVSDLTAGAVLDESFDLAVSVEVAEHLAEEAGDRLVASLTRLAPAVLFSAAAPHQGGVCHVNEQWPEYWRERFAGRGFVAIDAIRPRAWRNDRIAPYYAQNLLLFADERRIGEYPALEEAWRHPPAGPLDVVHPRIYLGIVDRLQRQEEEAARLEQYCRALQGLVPGSVSLAGVLRALPRLTGHALRRRLRGHGDR